MNDPKNTKFTTHDSITLTNIGISSINKVADNFHSAKSLHNLKSLDGIQQFGALHNLSLSYNYIKNWDELNKIPNKEAIR